MRTKFFMLLAAILLGSLSAMAQSGNNGTLKGDVNEDGVVDVADIVAVIDVMAKSEVGQTMYFWFTDEDNFSKIIYNGNILGNADQYAINSDTKFPMIQGKSYNPYYLIPQKFNINYEDYVINQNLYLIIPDNNIQIVDTGILILPNSTELTSSGFTLNVFGFYNNKQQFLYKGINYVVVIVSDEINDGLILKRR